MEQKSLKNIIYQKKHENLKKWQPSHTKSTFLRGRRAEKSTEKRYKLYFEGHQMDALNQMLKKKVTKRVARLELATTCQEVAQQLSEPRAPGGG